MKGLIDITELEEKLERQKIKEIKEEKFKKAKAKHRKLIRKEKGKGVKHWRSSPIR